MREKSFLTKLERHLPKDDLKAKAKLLDLPSVIALCSAKGVLGTSGNNRLVMGQRYTEHCMF